MKSVITSICYKDLELYEKCKSFQPNYQRIDWEASDKKYGYDHVIEMVYNFFNISR